MKMTLKAVTLFIGTILLFLLGVTIYFTVGVVRRDVPEIKDATVLASLSRESCIECHEPIAREWRESFHFRSVTGPFWNRIRTKGFDRIFQGLRIPCMNCHAPANVLDLPQGTHPVERNSARELGVDCVSCHVSSKGIHGPGRSGQAPHEVIPDKRFFDPALASTSLCRSCHDEALDHAKTVTAWAETQFAEDGVTCLHCHMPEVKARSVVDGPMRVRRSHRFFGDKDAEMLGKAVSVSIDVSEDRQAVVNITNRTPV